MIPQLLEHIKLCEETLLIVPNDEGVRNALAALYSTIATAYLGQALTPGKAQMVNDSINYSEKALELKPDNALEPYCRTLLENLAYFKEFIDQASVRKYVSHVLRVQKFLQPGLLLRFATEYKALLLELGVLEDFHRGIAWAFLKRGSSLYHSNGNDHFVKEHSKALDYMVTGDSLFSGTATNEYIEYLYDAALCSHLLSRQTDAIKYVDKAIAIQEEKAQKHPLGKFNIRFLQNRSATLNNIGQLCNEIECFAKMKSLGWRFPYQGVMLVPKGECVNPRALYYWREHVCAVTAPSLTKRFAPLQRELEYNSFWLKMPNGQRVYNWSAFIAVQKRWEQEKRGPILHLRHIDKKRGRECLERMGLPKDAWFVALHVRDQALGKDGRKVEAKPTSNRDVDILQYEAAIQEIAKRGGWIIRMGSNSMKPLPSWSNVIDYAHSKYKSDWMDIYCVAASRFFFGTASGLNGVPIGFGVPSILTNCSPTNIFSVCSDDLYIPKLMMWDKSGRYLNFKEALSPPFLHCMNYHVYRHNGVSLIDNTSSEIRDVVVEMLDRLDNKLVYTQEDEELQNRFRAIADPTEVNGISCRIGKDFIRKYSSLLDYQPAEYRKHDTLAAINMLALLGV